MVVIRLSRIGAVNNPKYRVTVADSRRPTCGKFIEVVGTYNPNPRGKEKEVELNLEKVNSWISKGAQPTARVKNIIKLASAAPKN
jgi:small subunit ribosomal protein S16